MRWSLLVIVLIGTLVAMRAMADSSECNFACARVPGESEPIDERFGRGPKISNLSAELKILVWNIYKGRRPEWAAEFRELSAQADLVLLQEVKLTDDVKASLEDFGGSVWQMATSFFMNLSVPTGVATGSQADSIRSEFLRTLDFEPFVRSPKVTVLTQYRVEERADLLVGNIHGINFRRTGGLKRQVEAALPFFVDHAGPAIFAGDFNTKTPHRLETLDRIMKGAGLTRFEVENPLIGPWPAQMQLDHVYVRGLTVHRARFLTEKTGSDHKPLWLEVSVDR